MPETENVLEIRAMSRVGSTLNGKYVLDRLLGVGGMASVYEATHRNGKRFAVKVLHAEVSIHQDTRQRFLREGYVANKVEHSGAVAVLDDDVAEDGAAFLVMELLEGEPVDAFATRHGGRLPLRAVLCIADQLLDVLAAADAKQIVHRDIKPANIFLTRQGQLKVLDFGVARLRGEAAGALTTSTGMTLGTPAFMPPEQALGRAAEIDGQSDLWAVGATMFGLITGRVVHEAQSAQEQMVFAATKPSQSLAAVDAEVPKAVVAIVDKALAFAKRDRWPNAAAMRDAVRVAHAELFAAETTSATLASMISQVRVAVPQATSPSDPMAPTALAEAVSELGSSVPPNATSLNGAAARVPAPAPRAFRVVAIGTVLVAIGIGVGVALTRGTSDVASGQSAVTSPSAVTSQSVAVASASGASSASASPSLAAPNPSPSASDAATTRPVTPAIPRPSAKPSATARDNFDHQ